MYWDATMESSSVSFQYIVIKLVDDAYVLSAKYTDILEVVDESTNASQYTDIPEANDESVDALTEGTTYMLVIVNGSTC
jgi:hypothetical protein